MLKAPCSYQGGKQTYAWRIVNYMPKDAPAYYDLFCGSGAVAIEWVKKGIDPHKITMVDSGLWGAFWKAIGDGDFRLSEFRSHIAAVPQDPAKIQAHMRGIYYSSVGTDYLYKFLLLQTSAVLGGSVAIRFDARTWTGPGIRSHYERAAPLRGPGINGHDKGRGRRDNPMMPSADELLLRVGLICKEMRGVIGMHRHAEWIETERRGVVYADPPYAGLAGFKECQVLSTYKLIRRLNGARFISERMPLEGADMAWCLGKPQNSGISAKRQEWLSMFRPGNAG